MFLKYKTCFSAFDKQFVSCVNRMRGVFWASCIPGVVVCDARDTFPHAPWRQNEPGLPEHMCLYPS